MTKNELVSQIRKKKSFLTVGLDPEIEKMPECLVNKHAHNTKALLYHFCTSIIDATLPFAVSYKLNTAYFEAYGEDGWAALRQTVEYIKSKPEPVLVIIDAKRGDIGNTSRRYAESVFDVLKGDAVTLSPYMGKDSVMPFLAFKNKWVILLALTSNASSADFQTQPLQNGQLLYQYLLSTAQHWGTPENTMFVVGATHPSELATIRNIVPHHFLLVPGVGAQGGTVADVVKYGLTDDVGLLINASRSILYADNTEKYLEASTAVAQSMQQEMAVLM